MHNMHLASVDMNLLVVLSALLETQSVRSAAARLALSPSATSHALSRLRDLFDDEILVRAGSTMAPTPRAERIRPLLARLLADTEAMLAEEGPLDPARLQKDFRIATSDYTELLVVRALSDSILVDAPGVNIHSRPQVGPLVDGLRAGDVDLALGVLTDPPPDIHAETLFSEQFVCLFRRGHPVLRKKLTIERYAKLGHVLVSRGTPRCIVDDVLARHGQQRRVARTVGSFLVAPRLVAETDYVLTIAKRVARLLAGPLDLVMRAPPIELSGFDVKMVWHRRTDADPTHTWLRHRTRSAVA